MDAAAIARRVRAPAPAAATPITWLLAIAALVGIDLAVTRTPLLWGKTDTWIRSGLERVYIWQTYEVARKLYAPRRPSAERVAILGNSRAWMPARDAVVERALADLAPGRDVRVDNLAIFGAHVGDQEIIARQLERLDPTLVVVTLGPGDLVPTAWGELVNPTGELLDTGWRDGPLPPADVTARVDRWAKTAWPLYRFRQFVRARLIDGVRPHADDTSVPARFASRADYFAFANRPRRARQATAAYAAWQRDRTLDGFVTYLGGKPGGFGFTEPLPAPETLTADSPGIALLDHLLARVAAVAPASFVLLMPENPLLAADDEGLYHRPGFSDRAAALIAAVAARHGLRVVDGRRWMPAEAFVDFVHLFPDVSGFQDRLAAEILHALAS